MLNLWMIYLQLIVKGVMGPPKNAVFFLSFRLVGAHGLEKKSIYTQVDSHSWLENGPVEDLLSVFPNMEIFHLFWGVPCLFSKGT